MNLSSSLLTAGALLIDKGLKIILVIRLVLGAALRTICNCGLVIHFWRNVNKYYKIKCEADNGALFFCSRCYEYIVIFKKYKKFDSFNHIYPL